MYCAPCGKGKLGLLMEMLCSYGCRLYLWLLPVPLCCRMLICALNCGCVVCVCFCCQGFCISGVSVKLIISTAIGKQWHMPWCLEIVFVFEELGLGLGEAIVVFDGGLNCQSIGEAGILRSRYLCCPIYIHKIFLGVSKVGEDEGI